MKRFILFLIIIFMLTGCKTLLTGVDTGKPDEQAPETVSSQGIGVGLVKVREADGDPAAWVKQLTFTSGTVSIDGSDATVTISGVSPGSGSMTTTQELDTSVGDSDIVTLDFQTGFLLEEAPDTEINISLDVTPSSGNATLVAEEDALQVKYDSTDLGEGSSGLTLGASPTIATSLAIGTDPADAGAIRLPNAGYIYSEADAAGTDISVIGVDSSEVVQIGASGATSVTITPATDVVGALTAGSVTSDAGVGGTTITASTGFALGDGDYIGITSNEIITFNAAGSIAITGASFDVDGAATATTYVADTSIEAPYFITNAAASAADAGAIRLANADNIAWEADAAGTDVVGISVDSSEVVQIAPSGASGVTITPAVTMSSTLSVGGALTLEEGESINTNTDDTFDFTRNDAGTVTITASDNDATAALTVLPGGAAALTLGGASATSIAMTTDGGTVTIDGSVDISAAAGLILENDETITNSVDGTVQFDGIIDLASSGITNSGNIADDAAFSVISSTGAVTVESVVFTGGAISSATTFTGSGDITTTEDLVVGDAKYIGSTTDKNAVQIEADGDIVLTDDITVGGGDIKTGAIALTVGDGTTTTITFDTDGTGDAEIVLENDSVGDAEIDWENLTASHIFTSPGITLTAEAFADALGIEFEASDDISDCSSFAATGGGIFYDDSDGKFKKCQDNVLTDLDTDTGGAPALSAVTAPTAAWGIAFDDEEKITWTTSQNTAGSFFTINNSVADVTNNVYLLDLDYSVDDDQPNADYIKAQDAGGVVFTLQQDGDIATTGTLDVTDTTEASAIGTAAVTIDGGATVAKDVWIGDDLTLDSDSAIITLGDDQDVLITHVDDAGFNITTTAVTSGTINLGNDDDANDDSIDLVLHDSGIITLYDANDDTSASLSVADGASAFTMSGGLVVAAAGVTLTGADASPAANGQLVYDNVVAGLDDGAFAYYGGGDTVYYVIATDEIPDDADDDKVVTYDKDTDRYYMSAAGSGDIISVGDCSEGACLDGADTDSGNYIRLWDGDSHYLQFDVTDLSANATISFGDDTNNLYINNGTAILDIAAAATVNIDKGITVDGQAVTITGADQANTITLNEGLTIGDGNVGTLTYSAASKTLTVADDASVNQDVQSSASPTFVGLNLGSATVDSGPVTLIQGDQTGDPQAVIDLTADANGDFSITTDTGDLSLVSAATAIISAAGENIIITGTSNTLTTTTGTGVTSFDFGAIDVVANDLTMDGNLSIGTNPADAGTGIRMTNNSVIEFEDSEDTGEVTALQVDSEELITIGDANASGLTLVPNTTVSGTLTSTGMLTATVGLTTTDVGVILSDAAAIDQSANNLVEITENSDSVQFGFGGTDLDIVWSDGVLNLRNAEDSVNAIVEIEGKDAGERGELRVLSDGDDKYAAVYHNDTDSLVYSSSGNILLAADADTDDYVDIDTTTNVTSISVPGSTGTLGTAAAEWDALYLNDSGVIYGQNDQSNTITSSATAWTFNQAIVAVDATFSGTTTVATLTQAAVASPTWVAQDSSTSADGTFDIKVDAATAKYAGVLNFYVDEGDGAGADGAEDVKFMTINGSGANSTASGTIEFERIGNFEMGLSSSNGTTSAGFIDLYEDEDETGSNYARIIAPVLAATYTLTLPTTDGNENEILKTDGSGGLSWTTAGTATAWDDITDPDNNGTKTITFDNVAEATVFSNAYDTAGSFFTINNTDADHANNTYLLDLDYSVDDGDVDADYIKAQDAGGVVFTLQQDGDMATTGTVTATGGFFPTTTSGAALGSDALDFSDIFLADAAVINFDSGDLTLTHSSDLLTFAGGAVDVDGDFTASTITADTTIGGTVGTFSTSVVTNLIDTTGAADIDIGSEDVTDITLLGQSEDLALTPSADTWTLSSSTGVTKISISALNFATTGVIEGGIDSNSDADGMTQANMTTAGMYGQMYWVTGAGTWELPAVATGMNICVYSTGANAIVINPDDADRIRLDGTALADGDSITSASAAGDFICLMADSADGWTTLGRSGTWTDTD